MLKGEIDAGMSRARDALDEVRKLIRENGWSDKNQDGLLMSQQEDYLQCIEIDNHKLEYLLRRDQEKWAENFDVRKRNAKELNKNLQVFFSE